MGGFPPIYLFINLPSGTRAFERLQKTFLSFSALPAGAPDPRGDLVLPISPVLSNNSALPGAPELPNTPKSSKEPPSSVPKSCLTVAVQGPCPVQGQLPPSGGLFLSPALSLSIVTVLPGAPALLDIPKSQKRTPPSVPELSKNVAVQSLCPTQGI